MFSSTAAVQRVVNFTVAKTFAQFLFDELAQVTSVRQNYSWRYCVKMLEAACVDRGLNQEAGGSVGTTCTDRPLEPLAQ